MSSGRRQGGFTYLAALFLVASIGAALASVAGIWSHARQREREAELVWIGEQFRQAIGLYYHRTPGGAKRYPATLEDLLEDRRFPNAQRYLRRIYRDPMTGTTQWGVLHAPEGGIIGVHSLSTAPSIRQRAGAPTYAHWTFVYQPAR